MPYSFLAPEMTALVEPEDDSTKLSNTNPHQQIQIFAGLRARSHIEAQRPDLKFGTNGVVLEKTTLRNTSLQTHGRLAERTVQQFQNRGPERSSMRKGVVSWNGRRARVPPSSPNNLQPGRSVGWVALGHPSLEWNSPTMHPSTLFNFLPEPMFAALIASSLITSTNKLLR